MYDLKTTILQQADDFAEAYRRCILGENPHIDNYGRLCEHVVNVPAVVNAAFSCELYLKCIIDKKVREHDLKILFQSLDRSLQEIIADDIDKKLKGYNKSYGFNMCLERAANVFEDWRYMHEKDYTGCYVGNRINEYLIFFDLFLNELSHKAHSN